MFTASAPGPMSEKLKKTDNIWFILTNWFIQFIEVFDLSWGKKSFQEGITNEIYLSCKGSEEKFEFILKFKKKCKAKSHLKNLNATGKTVLF